MINVGKNVSKQVSELKADIAQRGVYISDYGAMGDGITDDTAALQACFNEVKDTGGIVILLPGKTYAISSTTLRTTKPVTLMGYGATITPLTPNVPVITSYGLRNRFIGFRMVPSSTVTTNDKFIGIKVTNDATTPQSSYNKFRDLYMSDIYQSIWFSMDGNAGASYRHEISDCEIENPTLGNTWVGSFGISFDQGNGYVTDGNSSGNDSKIFGTVIKKFEKNVNVVRSIGTKLFGCGLDGALHGIYYDQGSYLVLNSCYVEYNTNSVTFVNNPYKYISLGTTYAQDTTRFNGSLYSSMKPTVISHNSASMDNYIDGYGGTNVTTGVSWVEGYHGVEIKDTNNGESCIISRKSMFGTSRFGFDLSSALGANNIGVLMPVGKAFEVIEDTVGLRWKFSNDGDLYMKRVLPVNGVYTPPSGSTTVGVTKYESVKTNNSSATTIANFSSGVAGQRLYIQAGDANTTIAHNANIRLKGGANKTLALNETIQLFMFITGVWDEV